MVRSQVFRDYIDTYREAISRIRYADMDDFQSAPYATLGQGGAGTAYALWRLGDTRRASAWASAAAADRRKDALDPGVATSTRLASTMFGLAGARWAHAVVAGGDRFDAYARAIVVDAPRLEFACGAAGQLLGALQLLRRQPHVGLEQIATRLTDRMLRAVRRRARHPWVSADATGFAHGWPGILYAVLAWHEQRSAPAPQWFADALRRLAVVWSPGLTSKPGFEASWCNGAAGAALLWSKAYTCLGDEVFSRVARRAARTALAASGRMSSLCCGDVGVAFAVLAVDRIDSDPRWRRHARLLAARTIAHGAMPWRFGLFQGDAGLVCLALDCLGEARGFPGIEA